MGHSIGEYVAACLAGVFTLEEALQLVALRGRLMQGMPAGAMLSVALPEAELRGMLPDRLALAAVNSTSLCVVAGESDEIDEFARLLEGKGCACRRLHTSHAFHSHMMDPILPEFADRVRSIRLKEPEIPLYPMCPARGSRRKKLRIPNTGSGICGRPCASRTGWTNC